MATKNATFEQLKAVIRALTGSANTIALPRELVRFFDGDYALAGMMSQLIYWDDKTTTGDRWIYKTADHWNQELCISEYQVRRSAKILVERKYAERKFAKNPDYQNGTTPVWHYRLDMEKFIEDFTSFLEVAETRTSTNSTTEVEETAPPPLKKLKPPTLTQPTTQPTTTQQTTIDNQPCAAVAAGSSSRKEKNPASRPISKTPNPPDETEQFLRSIGVTVPETRRRLRQKFSLDILRYEWANFDPGNLRKPGAGFAKQLLDDDWQSGTSAGLRPGPEKPKAPYLLPAWETWSKQQRQEQMDAYQIAERKWRNSGGRA